MFKKISYFLDKLEDRVRLHLSHRPITYSLIGGVGIVLFWRGIWGLSEEIGMTNLQSLIVSLVILLSTGLFVSFFIGDRFIISGLRREKKITEKTKEEILNEGSEIKLILKKLESLEQKIDELTGK